MHEIRRRVDEFRQRIKDERETEVFIEVRGGDVLLLAVCAGCLMWIQSLL